MSSENTKLLLWYLYLCWWVKCLEFWLECTMSGSVRDFEFVTSKPNACKFIATIRQNIGRSIQTYNSLLMQTHGFDYEYGLWSMWYERCCRSLVLVAFGVDQKIRGFELLSVEKSQKPVRIYLAKSERAFSLWIYLSFKEPLSMFVF